MVVDINDKPGESLLQEEPCAQQAPCLVSPEFSNEAYGEQLSQMEADEKVDEVSVDIRRLMACMLNKQTGTVSSECIVKPTNSERQALYELFDNRIMAHKDAIDKLVDEFDLERLRNINFEEETGKIKPHNFYSSHGEFDEISGPGEEAEKERFREQVRQLVSKIWRRDGRVFTKVPAWGNFKVGFSSYMALRCPRILQSTEQVDIEDRASICERLIKYQMLFLLATHDAMQKKDGHRRAYFWAQMGALTVNELRAKYAHEGGDAVTWAMKDKSDDQVRAYLDSMLSLIFPDKANMQKDGVGQLHIFQLFQEAEWRLEKGDGTLHDFVQEHFITSQLITLARSRGLWTEYGQYLEKLIQARKDQFINNFHLRPIGPNEGERNAERKISILELLQRYYSVNKKLPSMASLGCGDCQLELFLSRLGLINGPFKGVDLFDDDSESELYLEAPYGQNEVCRFNNKYREQEGFIDEVFNKMGSADFVFAGDVIHETESPPDYFLGAYDAVNPGGYLVVSDPIHCSAVDQVTSVSVNRFDSTEYPNSMLDLERYFEMLAYLTIQGARIVQVAILPGAYAGYNDSFWRISIVLQKPKEGEVLPYELPKEDEYDDGKEAIVEDEDIFKVWPLTEIKKEEERVKLLKKVREVVGKNVSEVLIGESPMKKHFLTYEDVKFHLVKWLMPRNVLKGEGDYFEEERKMANNLISENAPCKDFIDDFRVLYGRNENLEQRNHYAGEVTALVDLLYSECGIDIRDVVDERVRE